MSTRAPTEIFTSRLSRRMWGQVLFFLKHWPERKGGFHFKFQDKNPMQPFSGKFANFRTMRDGETARNFDYDYNSIMHYGPYFFRWIFYPEKKHLKIAFFFPARTSAIEWQRLFPRRQELTLDKGNLRKINHSKKTKTQKKHKNTKTQKYKNTEFFSGRCWAKQIAWK